MFVNQQIPFMKTIKSFLVLTAVLVSGLSFGQLNSPFFSQFKLTSFKTSFGPQADHYNNMSLGFMESRITDASYERQYIDDLEPGNYIMSTSGANLNLTAQFVRTGEAVSVSRYEAFETSLGLHFGREVMIDFSDEDARYGSLDFMYQPYSNITYCDLQNEINLSATYKRGVSLFNALNLYSGVGANIGSTVASQLMIFGNIASEDPEGISESVNESYSVSETATSRLYIPLGAELVVMKKLRLSAETRLGMGYTHSFGNGGFSHFNYAVLGGIGWTL